MCNWKKWIWPGILAVVLLTALASYFKAEVIERDLSEKASAALSANHPWASVELDGRDLTLGGRAPTPQAAEEALQIADNAYDVRIVIDDTNELPKVSPYQLSAVKEEGSVRLTGTVPSDEVRTTVVEAAKAAAPGSSVDDQLTLARGAPEGFEGIATYAIGNLSGLVSGNASVTDAEIKVSGLAKSLDDFDATKLSLAGSVPSGATVTLDNITPPTVTPYKWQADYDGSAVTMSGYAMGADMAKSISDAVADASGSNVSGDLRTANGAPEGYVGATGYLSGFFPKFSQGTASIEGNALSVSGLAQNTTDYDSATKMLENAPAGFTITSNITPPDLPVEKPYRWQADYDGSSIAMSGFAPSESISKGLEGVVGDVNPGVKISNGLNLAGGAPDKLTNAAKYLGGFFPRLDSGNVRLEDTKLYISGLAKTPEDYVAALKMFDNVPSGFFVEAAKIKPATANPYLFEVQKGDGTIVLNGHVSNAEAKADNLRAAQLAHPNVKITDNTLIASGAPAGFAKASTASITMVRSLEEGTLKLNGTQKSLVGRAASKEAAFVVYNQFDTAIPASFSGPSTIDYPKPAEPEPEPEPKPEPEQPKVDPCQANVDAAIEGKTIRFRVNRAIIREGSYTVLNTIADVLNSCPTKQIGVEGHTDSDGSDEYNQKLSEARAKAVRTYLAGKGVSQDRVTATGYGETRPIADNATKVGKTKNRRIEIKILN